MFLLQKSETKFFFPVAAEIYYENVKPTENVWYKENV